MKVLITGAGGFLGSALTDLTSGDGHEVFGVVRPGSVPALARHRAWEPLAVDLADRDFAPRLPARVDAILHLAQSRQHRRFPDGAPDMFRVNVAATAVLLDYAVSARASAFVFASTGSVYAAGATAAREDEAVEPTLYYPASKRAGELLAACYDAHFAVCCLRLFRLYGPGQQMGLIADILSRIRRVAPVGLPRSGPGPALPPLFVRDAAAVFAAAMARGWRGTVNVAGPETITLQGLAETAAGLCGSDVTFARAGEDVPPSVLPDLSRLAERIDLATFHNVRAGLSLTLDAARQSPAAGS